MHKNFNKRALLLNPLVLLLYLVGSYYLIEFAEYGGKARRLPMILFTFGTLFLWFLIFLIRFLFRRYKNKEPAQKNPNNTLNKISKIWYYFAIISLLLITGITGKNVYQSAQRFQGKLGWVIDEWRTKREVAFEHNNIYETGIDGILEDIEEKVALPDDLYIVNEFSLSFQSDGTITDLYTVLDGENDQGKSESFIISYDANTDEQISIHKSKSDEKIFDRKRELQPLIDEIQQLELKQIVEKIKLEEKQTQNAASEQFGIYYEGERNWEYNTDGIIYYNEEQVLGQPQYAAEEIIGYTISVFSEAETSDIPRRYVFTEEKDLSTLTGSQEDFEQRQREFESEEEFFLDNEVGFQLVVVDAALGSRFYALEKTETGGEDWQMLNEDPFNGSTGGASGITFIDQDLGFIGLSHNGGTEADLFRTTDGGQSFEKVEIPEVEVPLNEEETYNPFVFPEMPYATDGKLLLKVNQGADGDYKRGIRAIYESKDRGETWKYVKEEADL